VKGAHHTIVAASRLLHVRQLTLVNSDDGKHAYSTGPIEARPSKSEIEDDRAPFRSRSATVLKGLRPYTVRMGCQLCYRYELQPDYPMLCHEFKIMSSRM
jgi:hypothetical protein